MRNAILYIKREWKKCLILMLLFFVSFSFIAGSVLMVNAADQTIKTILPEVGGIITVKADIIDNKSYLYSDENKNGEYYRQYEIMRSMIEDLQQDSRISYVGYNLSKVMYAGTLNADLSPITIMDADGNILYENMHDADNDPMKGIFNHIENSTFNEFSLDNKNSELVKNWIIENNRRIYIYGDYYELLERKNNNIAIARGRSFSEEEIENSDFVCVLDINNFFKYPDDVINVNDVVSVMDYYVKDNKLVYSKVYKFKVVGIYERKNKHAFDGDRMYIPMKTLETIQEDQKRLMKEYDCNVFTEDWLNSYEFTKEVDAKTIDDIYKSNLELLQYQSKQTYITQPRIEVKNAEDVEDIADEIREKCSSCSGIKVLTSTAEYDNVAGPVTSIKSASTMMLTITLIISVALLSATIFLVMRERKVEAGIYVALGKERKGIVIQRILEVMIIASIALILSLKAGEIIGDNLSEKYMISHKGKAQTETQFINKNFNEISKNYIIKLDFKDVMEIIAICYGVTLVSTSLEAYLVTKTNAREVLMKD